MMKLDLRTLMQAGEALRIAFPDLNFLPSSDSTSIVLAEVLHTKIKEDFFLKHQVHLDNLNSLIRNSGQSNFVSVISHIGFIPHNPGTKVESEKPWVRAIINDQTVLESLSKVGNLERRRKEFIHQSINYFINHPAAPACLKQINNQHPLNETGNMSPGSEVSLYIHKTKENESLIAQESFFKTIGVDISVCKYKEEEAYRITLRGCLLFEAKHNELMDAMDPFKPVLQFEQLAKTVADLLKDNAALKNELAALKADHAALKEKVASSSTATEQAKSGAAPVHTDSPFAQPRSPRQ